jgi:hypothetical protein
VSASVCVELNCLLMFTEPDCNDGAGLSWIPMGAGSVCAALMRRMTFIEPRGARSYGEHSTHPVYAASIIQHRVRGNLAWL